MSRSKASFTEGLVELLATWEAEALPGFRELLEAVSESRQPSALRVVRDALETPPGLLEPELRRRLEAVREGYRLSLASDPSEFSARLEETLERLAQSLGPKLVARREQVGTQLVSWSVLLGSENFRHMFDSLWSADYRTDAASRLKSLTAIEELESKLATATQSIVTSLRSRLDRQGALDAKEQQSARRALDTGDPLRLLAVERAIRKATSETNQLAQQEQMGAIRKRLVALCKEGRELASNPEHGLELSSRTVLEKLIGHAETSLDESQPESTESLSGIEFRERSLGALCEAIRAGNARQVERRRQVAQVLSDSLGLAEGRGDRGDSLQTSAIRGGAAFREASERALEQLSELAGRAGEPEGAMSSRAVEELSEVLSKGAGLLPVEAIVQTRLLLDQVEGVRARGDAKEVEGLEEQVATRTAELRRRVERGRALRKGASEAKRQRLREEAGRALEAADGKVRRKLSALIGDLEEADPEELDELGRDLDRTVGPSQNEIRLEAAQIVRRATRSKAKRRLGGAKIERLQAALEVDDLREMVGLNKELRRNFGASVLSRPLTWVVCLALVTAGTLGGLFGMKYMSERPKDYTLSFISTEGETPIAPFEVLLLGANPVERREVASREATFTLPPGFYEVFVNDRYTGRVVRVPEDPERIEGIPVVGSTPD